MKEKKPQNKERKNMKGKLVNREKKINWRKKSRNKEKEKPKRKIN